MQRAEIGQTHPMAPPYVVKPVNEGNIYRFNFVATIWEADFKGLRNSRVAGTDQRQAVLSKRLPVVARVKGPEMTLADGSEQIHPGDRRAHSVRLTPSGRTAFAELAEAHEAWVAECLGQLSGDDCEQMMSVLKQIKTDVAGIES